MGALRGLAGLKFSTSPSRLGVRETILIKAALIRIRGIVSLVKNEGANLILSRLFGVCDGLEEPFS